MRPFVVSLYKFLSQTSSTKSKEELESYFIHQCLIQNLEKLEDFEACACEASPELKGEYLALNRNLEEYLNNFEEKIPVKPKNQCPEKCILLSPGRSSLAKKRLSRIEQSMPIS
jgi:hypothetical protein